MPDPTSEPLPDRWACALGHTFSVHPGDENCPERDREDGSWCGAPVSLVQPFEFERAWVWRRRDDGLTGVRFDDPANDGVMAGFASEYVEVMPASERDRLREAEKLALQFKDEAERCVKDLLAENDRLVGEVERLREALREIAEAEGFERTDASDEIQEPPS